MRIKSFLVRGSILDLELALDLRLVFRAGPDLGRLIHLAWTVEFLFQERGLHDT